MSIVEIQGQFIAILLRKEDVPAMKLVMEGSGVHVISNDQSFHGGVDGAGYLPLANYRLAHFVCFERKGMLKISTILKEIEE